MEDSPTKLPERLAVVLKNVEAVRQLYDYIEDGDIEKDLITARQLLTKYLSQSIHLPEGWRRPYLDDDIWLHPDKKWKVPSKDTIAIMVHCPSPVSGEDDDRDVSVNLYVPPWKLRASFTDALKQIVPRSGKWEYIRDCEPDEISADFPVGKWIWYADFVTSSSFDTSSFYEEIAGAVNELLKKKLA